MKLPSDPKERKQIFILIFMGSAFVIYILGAFIMKPMMKAKKESAEQLEILTNKHAAASRDASTIPLIKKGNIAIINDVLELSDKYVLEPRLGGNYELGAKEIIESYAAKAGVTVSDRSFENKGVGDIPLPLNQKGKRALQTFVMRIELICSYSDLVHFLHEIESGNPLVCVKNVLVSNQKKDKDKHLVTVDVQWPIWTNENTPEMLREELAGYLNK